MTADNKRRKSIAQEKGRDFVAWAVLGCVFNLTALLLVCFMKGMGEAVASVSPEISKIATKSQVKPIISEEKLNELNSLLNAGIITQEEYDIAIKELE